jgi:methyltransferase
VLQDTRSAYLGLIVAIALVRLAELVGSARNRRRLEARGAFEEGAGHYPWMVLTHAGFLLATPLEVFQLHRPFLPALGYPMLGLVAATMALRYWAICTLGERWCTRVIVLAEAPLVGTGPYRFLRHPNYLAVALEIPALALVHTAWWSALVFGVLNVAILRHRIAVEDAALGRRLDPASSVR